MQLAEHLRQVFSLEPQSWALEFEDKTFSWGELSAAAELVGQAVKAAGARDHAPVGWVAQNCPPAIASLVGLVLTEHCACILNPHMGIKVLCEEIVRQKFEVIVGDAKFWEIPGVPEAAKEAGSAGLVLAWDSAKAQIAPYPGLEKVGSGEHRPLMPGYVLERLSSGTTGPPKRSPQTMAATMRALEQGQRKEKGEATAPTHVKTAPAIIFKSLAHAGSGGALIALYAARPILLQEKFNVQTTIGAVAKHGTKVLQLVPTMIKMIMDANVPPEALKGLIAVRSGTAPLDPKLQEAFESRYGVPILVDYGATEFGGIAAWSLADHKAFAASKRGSVGRAGKGAQIRIRDPETGELVTDGRVGLLEVNVEFRTSDWVGTNDLAQIDEDGFLYILGRADDAIVRGGFKVLPDEVAAVLRQHPGVADVAVIGIPDERLGQAPVAVIETRPGQPPPDEAELRALAKANLTPYQAPVAYKFTDKLPRTASMKVVRSELLEMAKA